MSFIQNPSLIIPKNKKGATSPPPLVEFCLFTSFSDARRLTAWRESRALRLPRAVPPLCFWELVRLLLLESFFLLWRVFSRAVLDRCRFRLAFSLVGLLRPRPVLRCVLFRSAVSCVSLISLLLLWR
jgi:hypothetical protein